MAESALESDPIVPPLALVAAAPLKAAPLAMKRPLWRLASDRAFRMFGLGFAGAALFIAATFFTGGNRYVVLAFGGLCTALFAIGAGRAVVALLRMRKAQTPVPAKAVALVVAFPFLVGGFFSFLGAAVTLLSTMGFARGRQLRRHGKILLPPVEAGGLWAHLPLQASASEALRDALAARWRENGRTEHASVAAFARLTLDLMVLGAPPSLIEAANRDAKDEIRHTELCFSLARALDGKTESPGAFRGAQYARSLPASRTLALARLAVDSLVDGALHEGVSARVLARLTRRCEEPTVREALRELAADEGRHAAHGWDVVEWCLAEGGQPVAHALRGAINALPEQINSDLPPGAREGEWERHGIHGAALEAEEHARAREGLVRRVSAITATA